MTAEPIFRRAARPPAAAPNVLAVVLDDTGFAQLGCFGSDLATPAVDRLAAGGLRYNRFHVTALCSPSRASFLTGRNHHAVGMGFLADLPLSHHGYTARIPRSAATLPRILRDHGYSTLAVGKWHLTPRYERSAAGPFTHWPLGLGFERYYGFLQGDTNHYAPNLVQDNHYLDPPATPEEGYHLTEDLIDRAIAYLDDQRHAAPGKPFFLYVGLGATHSPHHVRPEWAEPYRGRFDQGWDAWREEIFRRQSELGVVPPGTVLTPRPPYVPAWADLTADRRRMYARQQEVFAGFLSHADAQLGRLLGHLEETGRLDDTIVVLFSDNGASAEGGLDGSVNEHRFSAGARESTADNLAHYDDWGGPRTYNHYAWGWAWAGNTPFRLWKRYTWLGGTRTPLIVHWPRGIQARGAIRDQIVHVNDLFPTLLDALGIEAPAVVDGIEQQRIDGASFRACFDDAGAPAPRDTQYFEMLGSRSLIHGRWKTTTDHVSKGVLDEEELLSGSRDFDGDHWALFDLSADFAEATDMAADHPEVVAELRRLWDGEAERNHVLPLFDGLLDRIGSLIGPAWPAGDDRTFRPGASPVCDESLPLLFGGFHITADVEVPEAPDGVLLAVGDWHGGFALHVAQGRLAFTFARPCDVLEVVADRPVPPGRRLLGVAHTAGAGGCAFHLLYGDTVVGSLAFDGLLPVVLQHGGAGLRLGYDAGLPVSERYTVPGTWNGGLFSVRVRTPGFGKPDPLAEVRAALHSD
ncbi:arylsulfatase [Nonomuraea gerenzanensis]|uniref:Arylsulfatase n=1 Tax=Nonomuraea gerenzanensis TaxID=93944 RepID=A0A1M4EBQ1_9ACTN|nr:arylsulfatase [Nonomuraea gerenzanensis]UBU18218.1 arylsulfatase [Nonomuraea gerenzanensis]SBO96033.1 Arylsulfatase [Nonomuraea gerenzanensis]